MRSKEVSSNSETKARIGSIRNSIVNINKETSSSEIKNKSKNNSVSPDRIVKNTQSEFKLNLRRIEVFTDKKDSGSNASGGSKFSNPNESPVKQSVIIFRKDPSTTNTQEGLVVKKISITNHPVLNKNEIVVVKSKIIFKKL